jgi:hypothetical protein
MSREDVAISVDFAIALLKPNFEKVPSKERGLRSLARLTVCEYVSDWG